MISQLRGLLIYKSSTEAVIDCGGVGYSVFISVNTSTQLPEPGEETKIFTLLIPREDALMLFGFSNEGEREAFKMLTSISGIGPKIALGVLSSLTVEELQEHIVGNNIYALQKLPGIGKKTAERLNLELRDRISKLGLGEAGGTDRNQNLIRQEALAALQTLGYSFAIADKAIKKAISENAGIELSAEQLIKKSLKYAMM